MNDARTVHETPLIIRSVFKLYATYTKAYKYLGNTLGNDPV